MNTDYSVIKRGYEHRSIAERAIGKKLPSKAEVHHIDGNKKNNDHSNLVICQDREYHLLLHRRQAAVNAGKPAHFRKCQSCKQFDDPVNLYIQDRGSKGWRIRHKSCHAKSEMERKLK